MMRKAYLLLTICTLAFVFLSCKQGIFDQDAVQTAGTVYLNVGGQQGRAVDSEGLPVLKDAQMDLKIVSSGKSETVILPAGAEKTWSGTFPVGEELTITVTVRTAAAQWRGSARHKVTSGVNTVSIKLKKSAAALNSLLFGTDKSHASQAPYTLTLKIGSEEIKKKDIKDHSFCRDNKGRTYLAYQESSGWKLERYTSEGKKEENKNFTLPEHCHRLMLASDHKTGKVYLVAEISWPMKLYRINEDGTNTELTGVAIGSPTGYAVYNNVVVASGYASGVQGQVLKMYGINGGTLSEIPRPVQPNLSEDTKIMLGSFSDPHVRINDLYMTENTLYVLFSGYNHSGQPHSLGGIVKYSYTADGTITKSGSPIGINGSHNLENGFYPTDENNFYGAVKVIGFDDENLYIADDGVRFEFEKGKPRIKENKNRIATLNRNDDTIIFTDAASGISWQNESPVWTGVNTKTLVWKVDTLASGEKHYTYYQLENAGDTLPTETFKPGEGNVSGDNYLTDVFCYDEGGNLYIVEYKGGVGALPKYQICRFELQDEGSYNTSPVIARLYESSHNPLSYKPTAIAVDTSGNVSSGKNVLYYSYGDRNCVIKRIEWSGDSFTGASFNSSWEIEGPQSTDDYTSFTSIAANQDGLFVGEYDYNDDASKYTIRVKKYLHNETGYDNSSGTVTIAGGETHVGDTIQESLNALYIQDGVLYGLTTKTKKEQDPDSGKTILFAQSGRLFKVANTSSFPLNGNASKLYGDDDVEDDSDGSFAPYRFIAVKPKKLVIASDGAYGEKDSNVDKNKNKVWNFTPDSSGVYNQSSSVNTHGDVKFSKELKWDTGCGFLWE